MSDDLVVGPCWVWPKTIGQDGYGRISKSRRSKPLAHKTIYEAVYEPVLAGLELDHLCRNKACVNPFHLQQVTHRVNVIRGVSPASRNARKMACLRGHLFTPENTRLQRYKDTYHRTCKTCSADLQRTRRGR